MSHSESITVMMVIHQSQWDSITVMMLIHQSQCDSITVRMVIHQSHSVTALLLGWWCVSLTVWQHYCCDSNITVCQHVCYDGDASVWQCHSITVMMVVHQSDSVTALLLGWWCVSLTNRVCQNTFDGDIDIDMQYHVMQQCNTTQHNTIQDSTILTNKMSFRGRNSICQYYCYGDVCSSSKQYYCSDDISVSKIDCISIANIGDMSIPHSVGITVMNVICTISMEDSIMVSIIAQIKVIFYLCHFH